MKNQGGLAIVFIREHKVPSLLSAVSLQSLYIDHRPGWARLDSLTDIQIEPIRDLETEQRAGIYI